LFIVCEYQIACSVHVNPVDAVRMELGKLTFRDGCWSVDEVVRGQPDCERCVSIRIVPVGTCRMMAEIEKLSSLPQLSQNYVHEPSHGCLPVHRMVDTDASTADGNHQGCHEKCSNALEGSRHCFSSDWARDESVESSVVCAVCCVVGMRVCAPGSGV
jgi:hypothetical protein